MARVAADAAGLVQRVVDDISTQIFRGELRPGDVVGELDIAARLDLSRTPVREALNQLIVRGLLEKEQGKSARVRRPSLAELEELYELRSMLESAAAARAAEVRTDEEAARIVELEETLRVCPEDDWLDVHRDFHQAIVAAAKRPKLTQIVEDLRVQSEIYIWLSRLDSDRQETGPREHCQLMESIRDHDSERAAEVMRLHMENTVSTVSRIARRANGQLIPLI